MTSCSLRRLNACAGSGSRRSVSALVRENDPLQGAARLRFDACARKRLHCSLRSRDSFRSVVQMRCLFRALVPYGREWQPGLREDHGND
jgi:hypothetical protein